MIDSWGLLPVITAENVAPNDLVFVQQQFTLYYPFLFLWMAANTHKIIKQKNKLQIAYLILDILDVSSMDKELRECSTCLFSDILWQSYLKVIGEVLSVGLEK